MSLPAGTVLLCLPGRRARQSQFLLLTLVINCNGIGPLAIINANRSEYEKRWSQYSIKRLIGHDPRITWEESEAYRKHEQARCWQEYVAND